MICLTALLAATVMFESAGKGGVLASYLLNKDYIANNLCENRSNKAMHCNGKCYLAKQLKKSEQQKDTSTPTIPIHQEETVMDIHTWFLAVVVFDKVELLPWHSVEATYLSRNFSDIFHPPVPKYSALYFFV